MDAADPNPAEFQGRRRLDRDCRYPQRLGGGRLRPVGPVLCNGHLPERRQLSGLPTPGICPAAFYPLHSGKGGRGELHGDHDRYFQRVRRDHRHGHVRYGRLCLHGGHSARRDCDSYREPGPAGEYTTLACLPAGLPVYHRHVLHSAADGVWAFFPSLHVHRPGSAVPGYFRRGGHRRQRQGIFEKLHRCVHGGGCYCPGLPDLLRFPLQQHPSSGRHLARCHNGMAVHWTADFQYADPHRACQGIGPDSKGDVGIVKGFVIKNPLTLYHLLHLVLDVQDNHFRVVLVVDSHQHHHQKNSCNHLQKKLGHHLECNPY